MKRKNRIKFIIVLIIAFLIYSLAILLLVYFEKYSDESNINNIFDAIWYSIVTLTTVGYGDMYPITLYGKIIGYFFVICSLGFLGFLISKLTDVLINFRERKKMGLFGTKFKSHIVIIEWDDFAKQITDQLVNAGNRVAIITSKKDNIDLIHEKYDEKDVYALFADCNNLESIKKTNIENASKIFINLEDDTDKLVYVLNLKKYYSNLNFVITLNNSNLKDTFHSAGVSYILSKNEVAAKIVASYIFETDFALYNEDLLSSSKTEEDFDIQEYKVTSSNPFVNSNYGETFLELRKKYNSILIGISKIKDNKKILLKNLSNNIKIELNDYLIIITNGKNEIIIIKEFGVKEGVLNN